MRRQSHVLLAMLLLCAVTFVKVASPRGLRGDEAAQALEKSDHWAYQIPRKVPPPKVRAGEWCRNAIDVFVLNRLEQERLATSPEATKEKLLRRVSLDLIGLPPTPDELQAFLTDNSPDAYERSVDRLLASPQYGERWSIPWLDAARYADSNGFQRDGHRSAWPFRDWVIRALNDDMPFDRFSIEQLAGDLLLNATLDQRIATGFHRGTTVNVEAGTDQEENRVNQIFDRVNVTGTVWLGTSLECCQCHDHKYDPFTQTEYYQLFAFFNNTEQETKSATKDSATREFIGPSVELSETPELAELRRAATEHMQLLEDACERHETAKRPEFTAWLRDVSSKLATGQKPDDVTPAMMRLLKMPDEKRNRKQQQQLRDFFFERDTELKAMRQELAKAKQDLEKLKPPTALVMAEMPAPRVTRLLKRGNFETPGDVVSAATPRELPTWRDDLPRNRLGFAQWLLSDNNPLVARVTVNRWWAEFFGRGLHATPEDFGIMADEPLHRELLDWLAAEFVESGWSMKHIHRLIVTSATYRQSARVTSEVLSKDPENKFFTRGPRHRLTAELIRDHALSVSGLLSRKLGGPPVYPPQPANIWRVTGNVDNKYPASTGLDRYRRGVYTVWRRSAPYPSFVNFDAPDRAACVVKRPRTNTPLQALTLLNDPVYVEAAVRLAERIQSGDVANGIQTGFEVCLSRAATADEVAILTALFESEAARFASHPREAKQVLANGPALASDSDLTHRAAWVSVANTLLNLDECINK